MKTDRFNVAHEAPISIMPLVQQVTDYDYALSVLFDKIDGYYDFFTDAKKKGRWVLLDNGVFEENVAMNPDVYANWITRLLPDEYIVPDVLEDGVTTIKNFEKWKQEYGDLPGRKIGVAQGKDLNELIECYKYMSENADKIAISFDYSLYIKEILPDMPGNKWQKWVRGRIAILDILYYKGILNLNKPHHLLGAALPLEFRSYLNRPYRKVLESLDTSNPTVYAIKKGQYPENLLDVEDKISQKLKELINVPKTDQLVIDSVANIVKFTHQNIL